MVLQPRCHCVSFTKIIHEGITSLESYQQHEIESHLD